MKDTSDLTLQPARISRAGIAGLPPWAAPGQGTEARLAEFFGEALNLDKPGADDDFFALGGTSLQAAAIFARIQREFGQRLPLATLYRLPTIRLLGGALDRLAKPAAGDAAGSKAVPETAPQATPASATGDCVQLIQAGTSTRALFIAPGIGGEIVGLAHLARGLDAAQTVFGLRSIGLEDGEEPLVGMSAIAAAFLAGIRRVQPQGPYQLFGVCWGGLVVLEIARQLRDAGEQVRLLALLDPPPVRANPGATGDGNGDPGMAAPSTWDFVARRLDMYRESLAAKPVREWPAYIGGRLLNIADALRRRDPFRGDPTEFLRWRVREANVQALRSYDPPTWSGGVCLLFTSERADGASRAAREFWARHLHAGGQAVFVPGNDTGDALAPGRAGAVASVLRERLAG